MFRCHGGRLIVVAGAQYNNLSERIEDKNSKFAVSESPKPSGQVCNSPTVVGIIAFSLASEHQP